MTLGWISRDDDTRCMRQGWRPWEQSWESFKQESGMERAQQEYNAIIDAFYAHVDDLSQQGHQQPLSVTERCLVSWFAAWLCGRYDVTPAENPASCDVAANGRTISP